MAFRKRYTCGYSSIEVILATIVLLVFAGVTLYLVNPSQLLLQKNDAARKKQVNDVGTSLISYAKSKNGILPSANTSWLTNLQVRGEIKELPPLISYKNSLATCKNNQQSGICYATDGKQPPTSAIAYTKLESISENTKCDVSLGETAWYVYDMLSVRGGIVCTVGVEPTFNIQGQAFKD
jgi:hypothetical protein